MHKDGNFIWFGHQLFPMWSRVSVSLVLSVFSGMLSTLDPLLMRRLIDHQLPHRQFTGAFVLVLAIAGCLLGGVLALLWSSNLNFGVEQERPASPCRDP